MPTVDLISTKLLQIEKDIFATYADDPSISVLCGNGALPIFYYHLYHTYQNEIYRERAGLILEQIFDQISAGIPSLTFCTGLTGVATMLSYLLEKDFLGEEIEDFLGQCDAALFTQADKLLAQANLDYLHGALGTATYFLNRYRTQPAVLEQLLVIGEAIHAQTAALVDKHNLTTEVFNCGMPHGTIGCLLFLTRFYTLTPNPAPVAATIRAIVQRVLEYQSSDPTSVSIFPSIVRLKANNAYEATYDTPNGWCYGDTMVTLGLLAAGQTLQDSELVAYATELALRTTVRNTRATAIIADGGLCHGTAGLAHMYKKWHLATGLPEFDVQHRHWLQQTLDVTYHADGLGGFKKYEGQSTYSTTIGLLDGASGVGMVLADFVQGQPSDWDRFISLS